MLSKELKQLVGLSGGKVIVSEGELKSSFVVMKLDEYLKEMEKRTSAPERRQEQTFNDEGLEPDPVRLEGEEPEEGLTNEELLDRINTDIAQLRLRNVEKEAVENFESDNENVKYDYFQPEA